MDKKEYQIKLENIILSYGIRVLDVSAGKENPTIGELVATVIDDITELNKKAFENHG